MLVIAIAMAYFEYAILEPRYSVLVIATAKRARQISLGSPVLTDKEYESPVTTAAVEIAEGKVRVC